MPREYTQGIKGRTLEAQTPDAVAYQPAARVVDTTVMPSKGNTALTLANALSSIQPSLKGIVDEKIKEVDANEKQRGMLGYLKGEDPNGQSNTYMKGYMALKWQDFGRQAAVSLTKKFEEAKDDPNFDVMGAIREQIKIDLQGIEEDPIAIDQYLSQVMPLTEQLPIAFQKHHQAIRDQEVTNMLSGRVADVFRSFNQLSAQEFRQIYDNEINTWQAMGKTKKDVSAAFVDQMVAYAEENLDPSVFEWAKEKGVDGIALMDVPGVAQKLQDAEARIEAKDKTKRKEENAVNRADRMAYLEGLIRTDPSHEDLSWENLRTLVAPEWFTPEAAASLYERAQKALLDAGESKAVTDVLISGDPMTVKANMGRTEYKKAYETLSLKYFNEMNPADPNSIKLGLAKLTDLYSRSGVPPEPLKNILSTVNTAFVDSFTGVVPPDVLFAIQLHKALIDSGNSDMLRGLTSDDSGTFLRDVNRRLGQRPVNEQTLAEAIQAVKDSRNDASLQLAKETVDQQGWREGMKQKVGSKFNGLLDKIGSLVGLDAVGENIEVIQLDVINTAKDLVKVNGMSLAAAEEAAIAQAEAKFTTDGHGNFFPVPKGMEANKAQFSKGMSIILDDLKKKYGEDNKYVVHLMEDGKSFRVRDTSTGTFVGTYGTDEVMAKIMPASFGTTQEKAKAADLVAKIKKAAGNRTIVNQEMGKLMPELEDRYEETMAILAGDSLSFMEARYVRSALQGRIKNEAEKVRKAISQAAALSRQGDILNDKGKGSYLMSNNYRPDTPSNVAELAKHYYKDNPKAALAMVAEGLVLTAKPDSDGSLAIGFGYNLGKRSVEKAKKDLRSSGVAAGDVVDVMAGKKAITVEQAIKLFEVSSKQYEEIAARAYGDGYERLAPHIQAVLFDMAYNAGSPSKFKTVLEAFKKGDYVEASKNLTLKYWDKEKKQYVNNERRVRLWREMLSGSFDKVLDKYITKKGK